MIKRQDLVNSLKFSLAIGDTNDPILNSISEEQLETLLIQKSHQLGIPYPVVPREEEALLLCLVKKEVYWKMATNSAPLYPLDLEGLKVKKDVRFDHYMKLIEWVEKEYTSIINDPKRTSVIQGEILINKPYTRSRYNKYYEEPIIFLEVDKITDTSVYFSINYNDLKVGDFNKTNVYVHTETIWDKYDDVLNKQAKKVLTIETIHKKNFKIGDLKPNTKYHVLLEIELVRGMKIYVETEVSTNESN